MSLPLRTSGSFLALVLTLAPSTGCGDDIPTAGDTSAGSSGTTAGTGQATTMVTSADTTAGPMTSGMTTGSSSSGDPDGTTTTPGSTGTTMGASSGDSNGSSGSSDSSGSSGGTTTMDTDGASSGSSGTTDGTTDVTTSGTTDATTGGTTDATTGSTTDFATDTGLEVDVPDFSGDFLLAVATPLDPTLPLQYIATFDYTPSGVGGGTVDVELQPLALDTGSTTTPRTFFGPPLAYPGVPVTSDGTFAIPVGVLNVAAETNPLFFIDAQAIMVVFNSQVVDADNVCGTLTGQLVFPVASPLDGTTFAAVRVADVLPASLPVVFPVACP